ncbi:hypothetical protein HRS00_03710 [Agrobacterium vaccinii]|nr:hypothetical protein HRS00_03710 [Agrobacterium vaccinii]
MKPEEFADAIKNEGGKIASEDQLQAFEEGDIALFESGAIVLHIAETHPGDRLDVRRDQHC